MGRISSMSRPMNAERAELAKRDIRPVRAERALRAVFIVLGLTVAVRAAGSSDPLSMARSEIQALVDASGADVSVAFRTLDGKAELLFRPDIEYHAASTMKIP